MFFKNMMEPMATSIEANIEVPFNVCLQVITNLQTRHHIFNSLYEKYKLMDADALNIQYNALSQLQQPPKIVARTPARACSIGASCAGQHHLGGKLASSIIFKAILSAGIPCKANWHRKVRFPGSTCSAHLLWEAARRGARTDRRIAAASPAEMPEKAGATQKPGASSCDAVHFVCRRWRRRRRTCSRARLSFGLRARPGHGS